jgi:hypothetical protein
MSDTFSKILNGIQFGSPEHFAAANKDMEEYNSSVEKNQSTPGHKFKWERYSAGNYRSCCGHEISDNGRSGSNKVWYDQNQNYFRSLNDAKNYAHDSHVTEYKGKPAKG